MESVAIVPDFNIFKYSIFCLCSALEYDICTFSLQGREKAFHTGVIITIALSTQDRSIKNLASRIKCSEDILEKNRQIV